MVLLKSTDLVNWSHSVINMQKRYPGQEKLKRGTLEVTVENGELLGLGNGCPYNERGYRTAKTDTYYGEALAVIRAGESGTVNVQVSDGKYACAVQIPVRNKEEVEEC